jgi:hypothetical protein
VGWAGAGAAAAEKHKTLLKTIEMFFAKRIKWRRVLEPADGVKFLPVSSG